MEIDYLVILTLVTYCLGAITKTFVEKIPSKFIPLQNLIIGLVAGLICYFTKIETDLVQSLVLCLMASFGAGGISDLKKVGDE